MILKIKKMFCSILKFKEEKRLLPKLREIMLIFFRSSLLKTE